ncbi:phage antirepressor [Lactococcus hircilactis]|uniref:Phage antirepressor n=2 Tax=Lactococcus hircilactis TaxID=1494462 RepID=A0A7X1ZBQ7_9LACT|nr:phage antirepressor [Lactococcus hircilactis]
MNELQNFNFNSLPVRTVLVDNDPWFVAKDVSDILEYSETSQMTRRLDKEDSMSVKLTGMNMKSTIINESGLYEAIIGSKKKDARQFKRWITHDVLPTIRKHGAYMTETKARDVLSGNGLADLLLQAGNQIKQLEAEKSKLNLELAEANERTRYLDLIFESTDDVLVTQIAQDYGIGSPTFNKLLANLRIQRKVNNQWILYSKYQAKGYIKSRTHSFVDSKGNTRTNITTTWTQRGREFLYRKLKKAGYLPEIEKLSVF